MPSVLIAAALNAIAIDGIFLKLIFADDEEDISNASTSIPFSTFPPTRPPRPPPQCGQQRQGNALPRPHLQWLSTASPVAFAAWLRVMSAGDAAASKSPVWQPQVLEGSRRLLHGASRIETWCTEDSFKASPSHRLMQPALLQEAGAAVAKRSRGRVSRLLWLLRRPKSGRGGAANAAGNLNQYRWGRVADRQTGQVLESHSSGDRFGLIEAVETGKRRLKVGKSRVHEAPI